MLKDARFLNYRPSQNGAACLMAAMNLAEHPDICKEIDVDLSLFVKDDETSWSDSASEVLSFADDLDQEGLRHNSDKNRVVLTQEDAITIQLGESGDERDKIISK